MRPRWIALLVVGVTSACGTAPGTDDAPDEPVVDASSDLAGAPDAATPDAAMLPEAALDAPGAAGNTIAGMARTSPFTSVATSLWIGMADDPATTVVYVFDRATSCADLATPGWDARITDGTQVLEMKMLGTTPRAYTVVSGPLPGPGEASVNYTLSSRRGTPVETSSRGGAVTLAALSAGARATGRFALTFPGGGTLDGTFDAIWCAGGHEP